MNWYYIDKNIKTGDSRMGPYTIDEMRELFFEKTIDEKTLIWHSGLKNWIFWENSDAYISKEKEQELLQQTVAQILHEKQLKATKRAGFGIRALAFIIDFILLSLIGVLLSYLMHYFQIINLESIQAIINKYNQNLLSPDLSKELLNSDGFFYLMVASYFLQALYSIFFLTRYGGTIGKLLLKLKVVNADTSKLTFSNAFTRFIFSVVTQFTIPLYGLGYLLVLIDPKKRALHDFLAKTQVIYTHKQSKEL